MYVQIYTHTKLFLVIRTRVRVETYFCRVIPIEVYRLFGGTYCFLLQAQRVSQARCRLQAKPTGPTQRNIPEDGTRYSYRLGNLRFNKSDESFVRYEPKFPSLSAEITIETPSCNDNTVQLPTEPISHVVTLLNCIRLVFGSNLGKSWTIPI
jgi:hypothetical protein